jgi:hypothetical protein
MERSCWTYKEPSVRLVDWWPLNWWPPDWQYLGQVAPTRWLASDVGCIWQHDNVRIQISKEVLEETLAVILRGSVGKELQWVLFQVFSVIIVSILRVQRLRALSTPRQQPRIVATRSCWHNGNCI